MLFSSLLFLVIFKYSSHPWKTESVSSLCVIFVLVAGSGVVGAILKWHLEKHLQKVCGLALDKHARACAHTHTHGDTKPRIWMQNHAPFQLSLTISAVKSLPVNGRRMTRTPVVPVTGVRKQVGDGFRQVVRQAVRNIDLTGRERGMLRRAEVGTGIEVERISLVLFTA